MRLGRCNANYVIMSPELIRYPCIGMSRKESVNTREQTKEEREKYTKNRITGGCGRDDEQKILG